MLAEQKTHGLEISGIRGRVMPGSLTSPSALILDQVRIRAPLNLLATLIPPHSPVRLERLTAAGLELRVELSFTTMHAQIAMTATPEGRLAFDLLGAHTDLVGVPTSLVAAAIRELLPPVRGLTQGPGARWEFDPTVLAVAGVELPPVSKVRFDTGAVELVLAVGAGSAIRTRDSVGAPASAVPQGRLALCPDPSCEQILPVGVSRCPRCGLSLGFCPTCRSAVARTDRQCSGKERHPLPEYGAWPSAWGSPARTGHIPGVVPACIRPAWEYVADTSLSLSTPVIAHGMAYVAAAGPSGAQVTALDLGDGSRLWAAELEAGPEKPFTDGVSVTGTQLFVGTPDGLLAALDCNHGRRQWAVRLPGALTSGCLAAGTGVFLPFRRRGAANDVLVALWAEDGARVWTLELECAVTTPLAAGQGRLFAGCSDGSLTAVTVRTGEVAWRQPLSPAPASPLLLVGGMLLCVTEAGALAALAAESGKPRWEWRPPESPVTCAAAGDHGAIHCAAGSVLHSLSADGKPRAEFRLDDRIRVIVPALDGALVITERAVMRCSQDGHADPLHSLPDAGLTTGAAMADSRLLVGSVTRLYGLRTEDNTSDMG